MEMAIRFSYSAGKINLRWVGSKMEEREAE